MFNKLDLNFKPIVYVGDSEIDIKFALNCKMKYQHPDDYFNNREN